MIYPEPYSIYLRGKIKPKLESSISRLKLQTVSGRRKECLPSEGACQKLAMGFSGAYIYIYIYMYTCMCKCFFS